MWMLRKASMRSEVELQGYLHTSDSFPDTKSSFKSFDTKHYPLMLKLLTIHTPLTDSK